MSLQSDRWHGRQKGRQRHKHAHNHGNHEINTITTTTRTTSNLTRDDLAATLGNLAFSLTLKSKTENTTPDIVRFCAFGTRFQILRKNQMPKFWCQIVNCKIWICWCGFRDCDHFVIAVRACVFVNRSVLHIAIAILTVIWKFNWNTALHCSSTAQRWRPPKGNPQTQWEAQNVAPCC